MVEVAYTFCPHEMAEKLTAPTIGGFAEKLKSLLDKFAKNRANIKSVYDKAGYVNVAGGTGAMETYVEGEPSKLRYTSWEEDNVCTKPTQKSSSNRFSRPGAESSSDKFKSVSDNATVKDDSDLPF
jgi:hypothetical protein